MRSVQNQNVFISKLVLKDAFPAHRTKKSKIKILLKKTIRFFNYTFMMIRDYQIIVYLLTIALQDARLIKSLWIPKNQSAQAVFQYDGTNPISFYLILYRR